MVEPKEIEPTQNDADELNRMLERGTTPFVAELIKAEIKRVEDILSKQHPVVEEVVPAVSEPVVVYEPVKSYAFSDGKLRAQVYISDVYSLEEAEIKLEAAEKSFTMIILREHIGLVNLKLSIQNLYKKIVPDQCTFRKKGTTLIINLKKAKKQPWLNLKASKLDKTRELYLQAKDPNSKMTDAQRDFAAMQALNDLYEHGNDETRRKIAEIMEKAKRGELPPEVLASMQGREKSEQPPQTESEQEPQPEPEQQ